MGWRPLKELLLYCNTSNTDFHLSASHSHWLSKGCIFALSQKSGTTWLIMKGLGLEVNVLENVEVRDSLV